MDPEVLGIGVALAVTGVAVLGGAATSKLSSLETSRPAGAASVVVAKGREALAAHVEAWDELAAESLEVNPFYESWMLLPAVEAFGKGRQLEFALVYRPHDVPGKAKRLVGFFPLERRRFYKGLPASALRLWKHGHCFVCTPLLHARYAPEALAAFLEWAGRDRGGAPLIEFYHVPADGPFHQQVVDYLNGCRRLHHVPETFNRALFRKRSNEEVFLSALSTGYRKEMRRLRKRLSETGRLEFRTLAGDCEFDIWFQQFIDLEARGWKGRAGAGTAIALHENETRYYREVWRAALRRDRLQMAGLYLDGRPIAITVNYLVGEAGFHCKISYDEVFKRYSPGVQLELELIREAHARERLRWLDSCAVPDHPMINRLWPERRTIQTVLLSTGRWGGDLSVSVLPMLRWAKRLLSSQTGGIS